MQDYLALLNEAKAVLQQNTITVTVDEKPYERVIPSRDYYVHQWLWDSAGIAMGQVHLNAAILIQLIDAKNLTA